MLAGRQMITVLLLLPGVRWSQEEVGYVGESGKKSRRKNRDGLECFVRNETGSDQEGALCRLVTKVPWLWARPGWRWCWHEETLQVVQVVHVVQCRWTGTV